ncbi:MAG: dihydrofolate reductase family protein [Anaerolineales bacterium]|jgi:riboflavin biosynthesis pyrimidine reductase
MGQKVISLYPPTGETIEHKGLYLRQELRSVTKSRPAAFVYANFIVSIDGRIAVPDPKGQGVTLATQITNSRDWRLFQELAVQADVLISSGRYLREYEQGPKQELLQVYDDPEFEDLGRWRQEQGLSDYPAVAVVSRSLDFDVPAPLQNPGRELFVFTTENANSERKESLSAQGATVVIAGEEDVQGSALISGLNDRGNKLIYSTAGPNILHMLLVDNVLDRLYLTIAMRVLGGNPISTVNKGPLLDPPADFELYSLFLDPDGPANISQLYATFDHI